MFVTLDVYSGRPNPAWKLSAKDVKKLVERVEKKSLMGVSEASNELGYRGLILNADSDETLPEGIPSQFRLGGNFMEDLQREKTELSFLSHEEDDDTVRWLLSTAKRNVDDELMGYIDDSMLINRRGIAEMMAEELVEDKELLAKAAAPCIITNTAYNPGFWNNPATQPNNNCYNYAMNYRSNTFAQPGRRSGHPNSIMQCPNVGTAANWDGCTSSCTGHAKLVALVIWPGRDYHWYRRHSEGFWGHKPGQTAARNTDNSGLLINGTTRTPYSCNRGPYTVFCGYRYSPTGMIVS